ncbi:hypothetical protein [Chitinophaga niabensis]|uniref:Uncharacterized protein n=1 Tax=Chitinophaga niabensis TaxID=536979 RepID=A0A1N6EEF1_9BACT|nr:hypothetical protein [Chitinophaga niabensis]SIN81394.1 hypothetical protein SAMN04488055_1534 [Chitinophaga niabensis]
MRFLLCLFLTALLAYVLGIFLDWWCIAIAAFVVALAFPQTPAKAFGSGFLGVFLLWGIMALIIDYRNDHILAGRMGDLILKQPGSPVIMIIITALLGGIVGAVSALSGSMFRPVRKAKS